MSRKSRKKGLPALREIEPREGHAESFADAIAGAGVEPLPDRDKRVAPAPRPAAAPPAPSPRFEVVDEEGWLEGYRSDLHRKARRALGGVPSERLDLHGHDVSSARRAVAAFVARARKRGHRLVLLVVGRGRHSPGGVGVLRHSIGEMLTRPPVAPHVLAFRTASPRLGGDGAILVLLRREPR